MHYANLVIIAKPMSPTDEAIQNAVKYAMGPDEENGGFWGWYQIGGRWTGLFDGYDPATDPTNVVVCEICNGTGTRTMPVPIDPNWRPTLGQCNGCDGKGKHTAWPTQWKQRAGDVLPVTKLTQEHLDRFYRVVIADRGVFGGEKYLPWRGGKDDCFVKLPKPPLEWLHDEYGDYVAVIVDNHQ